MSYEKTLFVASVLAGGILLPATASAASVRFCAHWRSTFVDAGHGEDADTGTSATFRDAAYAHYEVRRASNDSLVSSGILDGSGCTGYLSLSNSTQYKFRQATWLERTGNRRIYVNSGSTIFGPNYWWVNTYYTTPSSSSSVTTNINPNWHDPAFNIAEVASRVLRFYDTREYPSGTQTYISASDDFDTSYSSGANIAIDSRWTHMDWDIDQSQYKFIVGHEIGHRQADATGGPLNGSYSFTSSTAKCNCSHFPDDYDDMCMQSKEYIAAAEMEAWAFFYAAALFNDPATNCGMSYWRDMYTGSSPSSATLDTTPPVTLDCAANPKWMETLCSEADRGVAQDWIGFFWDLWTNGTYKYTVNEITDVWRTNTTSTEHWDELLDTVDDIYSGNQNKIDQFVNKGATAGVDH